MRRSWMPLLFSCLVIFCLPSPGSCNLKTYIRKYLHTTIPSDRLEKISRYNQLIDHYSSFSFFRPNYKVSPEFIRALIIAESSCDPQAVSEKNALGLCQILFSTAKPAASELARSNFPFKYIDRDRLRNLKREDLFDPAINILLGCYLISKYNTKYNGKLELVLTAWNAGENTDSLEVGQPAPYPETYDLIGKVNGYFIFLLDRY